MPWLEWVWMLSTWHFFSDRLTVENVDARPNFSLRVTCVLNTVDQLDFNRVSSRSVFTTVCLLIPISKVSNKIYTIYFITLGIKKNSQLTSPKAFHKKRIAPWNITNLSPTTYLPFIWERHINVYMGLTMICYLLCSSRSGTFPKVGYKLNLS